MYHSDYCYRTNTVLISFYIIIWSLERSSFSFCDTIIGIVVLIILWSHHCRHHCNYCNPVIETFLSYEYCIHFVSSTANWYRTTTLCMSFRIKHHLWSLWSLWLGPVKLGSSVRLLFLASFVPNWYMFRFRRWVLQNRTHTVGISFRIHYHLWLRLRYQFCVLHCGHVNDTICSVPSLYLLITWTI